MFKKSEESEWTRFSRALGGSQPAPTQRDEALPADERDDQDPVTISDTTPLPPAPSSAAAREDPDDLPDLTRGVEMASAPAYASAPQADAMAAPMASASETRAPDLEGDETVLSAGAHLEGALRSEQSIRIAGTIQGEVESKRRVVVDEGARVQARISAEHVTVLGEVNGTIECGGRLEIAASGRVSGDVSAGTLVIQEGAFFEGHLKMSHATEA